jgi:hypothetical protein
LEFVAASVSGRGEPRPDLCVADHAGGKRHLERERITEFRQLNRNRNAILPLHDRHRRADASSLFVDTSSRRPGSTSPVRQP